MVFLPPPNQIQKGKKKKITPKRQINPQLNKYKIYLEIQLKEWD